MRRHRPVAAGTGKGSDFKSVRADSDGKDAKLGYASDDAAASATMQSGTGTNPSIKTSKWQGRGKRS